MKQVVTIIALVALHLIAFEALVRLLGLRDFGYTIQARDILLICCVPFAVPTIPALLETRFVTMTLGLDKLDRLEKGVYPVDVIAGSCGILLGVVACLLAGKHPTLLWPLLVMVMLAVIILSGWAKYDILKKKLNGGLKEALGTKSLGMIVFGGNMLANAVFLGAWLLLITQKVLS
jgi:hypothetical protein